MGEKNHENIIPPLIQYFHCCFLSEVLGQLLLLLCLACLMLSCLVCLSSLTMTVAVSSQPCVARVCTEHSTTCWPNIVTLTSKISKAWLKMKVFLSEHNKRPPKTNWLWSSTSSRGSLQWGADLHECVTKN